MTSTNQQFPHGSISSADAHRLRLFLDSATDYALFMLDREGRVSSWNAGAQQLLGYEEDEILGESFHRFFSEEDVASGVPDRELKTAREQGRAENDRWQVRKGNIPFWASGVTTPLQDGRVHGGYAVVMRDLTERKLLEDRQAAILNAERAARLEAEAVGRLKDEFLATLSHELRTPVSAILGWVRLLRLGKLDKDERENALKIIERNSTIQVQLIEDLLDSAGAVSGKISIKASWFDLAEAIDEAVESVSHAAIAKEVQLVKSVEPDAGRIYGDRRKLQQVIWNLLTNAVKFTPPQGTVEIGLERQAEKVRIWVRDTGEGISADFLPHVFERFRQRDSSTTRQSGGLGLGMAIASEFVQVHGGTILAESAGIGQGSLFVVELPAGGEADGDACLSVSEEGRSR